LILFCYRTINTIPFYRGCRLYSPLFLEPIHLSCNVMLNNSFLHKCIYSLFLLCIFSTFSFIFPLCHCVASDDTFTPWNFNNQSEPNKSVNTPETCRTDFNLKLSLFDAIRIVYRSVSAVDGDRCRMSPTCSEYSIQAFKKHGFLIGFFMTFDRLNHENDELFLSPLIKSGSVTRAYDPVSNNDFWWHEGGKLDK